MSYMPVGLLLSEALKGREAQVYTAKEQKCDASQDEVWLPSEKRCFKPRVEPIPWNDMSHPFWSVERTDRYGTTSARKDHVSACRELSGKPKEWNKVNNPKWWPNLTPVKKLNGRSTGGVWVCDHQPGCCRGETSPRGVLISEGMQSDVLDIACLECDYDSAYSLCERVAAAGSLPAGYEGQCTQWLVTNPGKRVRDFLEFLNNLPSAEQAARAQQAATEVATSAGGQTPGWILPAVIAGGALVLVLALRKK